MIPATVSPGSPSTRLASATASSAFCTPERLAPPSCSISTSTDRPCRAKWSDAARAPAAESTANRMRARSSSGSIRSYLRAPMTG